MSNILPKKWESREYCFHLIEFLLSKITPFLAVN